MNNSLIFTTLATRWLLIEKNADVKTPQSFERGVFIGKESPKQFYGCIVITGCLVNINY